MRNFTLGKNGIPLFFFALFLMIGTSSYGQCPTLSDQTPEEFCYLSTIADLTEATGATVAEGEVAWYRTATSTTPIPENELLEDENYFAGNLNGTCTERVEVIVTVDVVGPPTSTFGITFQPCVYLDENGEVIGEATVQDLANLLVGTVAGSTIAIYPEEFSENALPPETPLEEGENYFAGQFSEGGCPSSRLALRYDPILTLAPDAEPVQIFCEGATVANLTAQATSPYAQNFRWYSTRTSNPPLAPSTPLIDGETYYATQIINRSDSPFPPCESIDRAEVLVQLEAGINELGTQAFCESFSTPEEEFDVPRVEDLNPAGPFYAEAESIDALDPQTELIDGEDYFSRSNTSQCAQDRVVVDIFPTPNAGKTTQVNFCENEDPVNLVEYIEPSILGKPDPDGNGFFSPALSTGTKIFNPTDYAPGVYSFTYTVPGNDDCPTDRTEVTVTVEAVPIAGADVNETICLSELENREALIAEFSGLLAGRDEGGTFEDNLAPGVENYNLEQFLTAVYVRYSSPLYPNGVGTYSYTYTVIDQTTLCADSALLQVEILESPEAGDDVVINLEERDDSIIDLFNELGGTPTANGTFTNEAGVEVDATFDPTSDEPGVFTYTVTNTATGCTDTATVTINPVQDCPEVTNLVQRFCASIGDGNNFRRPNVADLEPANAVWYSSADSAEPLAATTNLVDGEDYFAGNADGTCENREMVTVEIFPTPNAGRTSNVTFCSNEGEVNLVDFIAPSILGDPDRTGYFVRNGQRVLEGNIFDPADFGAGSYSFTYTVPGNEDCETDTSVIRVTVSAAPDAGESLTINLEDRDDSVINLLTELGGDAGGTWNMGDGTFNPASDTPGSFTYSITANGCTDTATVNIIETTPQECPEVTSSVQRFCASIGDGNNFRRPNVADLEPANAVWYSSADSTEPLAATTNLVDGEVYFAGNADGTCENREMVTVEIFPTPNAGRTSNVTFCSNEGEVNLVDFIAPSILGDPDRTGYFVRNGQRVLEGNIFDPADFDAGSYSFTYTVPGNEDCETDTSVIRVTVSAAPDAGESLTINLEDRDDSVIDLLAELGGDAGGTWNMGDGIFDPTSDTPGSFTYSITANRCTDTATVTIISSTPVDCPEVTNTVQRFCASIGDGNNSRRPNVADLEPANAVWYASANSTDPLATTTNLVDGEDYFAGNADASCENREMVTVEIFPTPNAGRTSQTTFCASEDAVNLVDRIAPSVLGAPQQTGFFRLNGQRVLENNMFDPSEFEAGVYEFTYVVEGNEDCPTDTSVITVTVKAAPNAGPDINEEFCVADVSELIASQQDFMDLFAAENRTSGGTFSPSLETLAAQLATDPFQTFSTTYTVSAGDCTDTANLSVTINERLPAEAGDDVAVTFCSTEGSQNLFDYLPADAVMDGVFEAPYADGNFDPATAGNDPIEITYTVGEDVSCVSGTDTSVITVTVLEGPNAGEDTTITLDVNEEPVDIFTRLNGTPSTGGVFTPTLENGILDPSMYEVGTYTFTYTIVGENGCEASAVLTVIIEGEILECPEVTDTEQVFCESIDSGNNSRRPRVSDLQPAGAVWYATAESTVALAPDTVLEDGAMYFAGNADATCDTRGRVTVILDDSPNAGATTAVTLCETADPVDLVTLMRESVLGAPDAGGTFSPALASGTTIFDPSVDAAGQYTYRVESTNDACPADTAVITITITEAATAGPDVELNFCSTEGPQDLYSFLPEGTPETGTFEDLADGIFDPSANEAGEYTFDYTVTATGTCEGTTTATYTIIVDETPAAPTVVSPFEDCVVTGATVADLDITAGEGNTVNVFTDEAMQTPAEETDLLVEGTYYVTQTNEAGCESEAAMITVTLTDSEAPTLMGGGNVFCEFDQATIADLEMNISGDGEITWYASEDGTETVSSNEILENDVTYYAAMTDADSACESSERLAVTIVLEPCDIIIPEAFSPNGDGINDRFIIPNLEAQFPNFELMVYNRWGEQVYVGSAGTPGWDGYSTEGSFGDGRLPAGVYFYILYFNDGETAPVQGRVYLSI